LKKAGAIHKMFKTKSLVDVAAMTLQWVPSKGDIKLFAKQVDSTH